MKERTDTNKQELTDLAALIMGTDGGITKTASANHLSDFYDANGISITRVNLDPEKLKRGSFASFHSDAINLDIRGDGAADALIDIVKASPSHIALGDMAANLGKFSLEWFHEMHASMAEEGIQFLFIGVITSSSGSVEAVLHWASIIKNRARYLLFENEKDGADFGYLHQTPQGKAFLAMANPPIIRVSRQLPEIQAELDNRNLTLRQALYAPEGKELGPVLSKLSSKIRLKSSYKFVQEQLLQVKEILLP